jgi:hypothetical protein
VAAAGAHVVSVVTIDEGSYRQPTYAADLSEYQAVPTPAPDTLDASVTVSVVWRSTHGQSPANPKAHGALAHRRPFRLGEGDSGRFTEAMPARAVLSNPDCLP